MGYKDATKTTVSVINNLDDTKYKPGTSLLHRWSIDDHVRSQEGSLVCSALQICGALQICVVHYKNCVVHYRNCVVHYTVFVVHYKFCSALHNFCSALHDFCSALHATMNYLQGLSKTSTTARRLRGKVASI